VFLCSLGHFSPQTVYSCFSRVLCSVCPSLLLCSCVLSVIFPPQTVYSCFSRVLVVFRPAFLPGRVIGRTTRPITRHPVSPLGFHPQPPPPAPPCLPPLSPLPSYPLSHHLPTPHLIPLILLCCHLMVVTFSALPPLPSPGRLPHREHPQLLADVHATPSPTLELIKTRSPSLS